MNIVDNIVDFHRMQQNVKVYFQHLKSYKKIDYDCNKNLTHNIWGSYFVNHIKKSINLNLPIKLIVVPSSTVTSFTEVPKSSSKCKQ